MATDPDANPQDEAKTASSQGAASQQLVRGLAWTALLRFTGQGITWAITLVVINLLEPKDYGLMGKASVFIGFLGLLSDGGMGESVVQKQSLTQRGISALFWIGMAIGLTLFTIAGVTIPLTENYFNEPGLGPILLVAAFGLVLNASGEVHGRLLVRDLRFKESGFADLTAQVSASLTTLILAALGFGVYSLAIGGLTNFGVRAAMRWYYTKWKPMWALRSEELSHHLKFGGAVLADRLLWYSYTNADFMIAGALLAADPFGVYSVAFTLASLPLTKVTTIVNSVLYPVLSRSQNDRVQHQATFCNAVRGLALLMFPMLIGLALVSPEFVRTVFGSDWSDKGLAFPLAAIAAVNCLRVISPLFNPLLNSIGKPSVSVKTMAVALAVMGPTFYFAARHGIDGLAKGWLFGYPAVFAVIAWISLRAAKFSYARYFRAWIPAVVCTLSMTVAVFGAHHAAVALGANTDEFWPALSLLLAKSLTGAATVIVVGFKLYGAEVKATLRLLKGKSE